MKKTIQSVPVTFIDQTDSRKLEVYITSNLPTVQIFNQNSGAHTPDWIEGENLVLSMDVFLDSRTMTVAEYNGTAIKWYKNGAEMSDDSIEDISDDKRKITIKDNILKDDAIITYTCEATYQGIVASSRITFTRVDSGINGNDGADGTSVNIKATASSVTPISGTDYYTITYSGSDISSAELNDAYMYNGDLYVCVDSRDGVDYFINVGRIQGPAGEPAKNIVLSGSAQVFKISKTNVYTPTTISVTAHTFNTSAISWTYSTNGGQTFLSTVPTGVSRNGNIVTIAGSTLASNSIVVKASDGAVEDVFTIYKAFDGTDGSDGKQGDPAPLVFLTNENISFAANTSGQISLTSFTTNVVSYIGTTKTTPAIGTITGLPTGMTVSAPVTTANELILTFSIANNATFGAATSNSGTITIPVTSPVSTNLRLNWSKINTGATGVGIESTTVSYGVSDSSSSQPTDWQSTIPAVAEGKYLWTRTIIDYTDEKIPDTVTYIYAKQGTKGDSGTAGSSVSVSSVQYQSGASATTAPTGTWSNAVVAPAEGQYLWTKTTFSDSKIAYGVAKQGVSGKDGVGISSVTVAYGTSTSASVQPTTWQDAIPVVAEGSYLWTRTITDYTNTSVPDTVTYTYAKQGAKGSTGTAGTSIKVSSIQYQAGTSATIAPTGTWSDSVVAVNEGQFLWTKTTFSDNTVAYGVAKQGSSGRGVSKITEYYLASTASSGITTATSGWTTTIQTIDSSKRYLWNYEVVTYTDTTTSSTTPIVIGVFGSTGATGKGIKSVTEYYLASASSSGVVTSTDGWTTAMQTLTATNKYLWNYELITYTDNTTATIAPVIIGVYGDKGDKGDTGNAGRGISSIVEQYYHSTSATSQTGGSWVTTAPTWVDGKYIWTRSVITYTDTTTYTTSPICVTGQKGGTGGTGATGVGVSSVDVWYYHSTSATALSGGSWATTAPTWSDGKYVWTKTITTYTNGTTDETAAVCVTGQKGSTGVGIKSVAEYYLATASSSGVTISTTGWTTAIQTITADKKYLWNYEIITYTDNTTSTTSPIIIGVFGNTGAAGASGKGIKSITEYYLATASASGVVTTTTGWTTTMQTLTATNKYLWNYELITYTDNSTATINPVIIGVYGDRGATGVAGADAYTVLLTNESHVFAGTTSSAVASSATTQILAYKGTAAQSITIVSVNGVAAATASTATGIAGLSFACSTLSGASPTITFTCTTSFVSPSGTIPIVLSVGGISITKMFTYSIAFKGATGGTGSVGPASSSYWLVSNASAVQKTSSGDILCTPATLTFTGRIQTGTSAPANYAGRWILAYSTDGSTYTDSYTSTANEATASIAASSTYKAVRARMYLAGGTTTLLDEQIIPFVSDGETGAPGATGDNAVTFQVYSNNGYALSTSIPTILLQTFAYFGDVEITSGATFQWYRHNGTDWVVVSEATNSYFNVSRDDVSFSNNYMCKMQFNGTEYVGVVTIDDKNDENKVFASKPSNYFAGDLWIVGTDYAPPGYSVGTMLRAEHTNGTYTDSDWVPATKYDDEIDDLRSTIDSYKEYFSVDSTNGLQIGNSSINNDVLTIDHIETSTIDAISANIESLDVVGRYSGSTMLQAPVINLGKFSLVIESNGSLSIVANT